jgi:hypothetical protein
MEQTLKHLNKITSPTQRKLFNLLKSFPEEKLITTEYIIANIEKSSLAPMHTAINFFLNSGWIVKVCRGAYMKTERFKNII